MRQMFTITATALLCLLPLLGAAAGNSPAPAVMAQLP